MQEEDYSASINEAILRNEINRLRSTYSFRLGFLLTESFFRKPWLIPIFPFRFIKLNLDFFFRTKNSSTQDSEVFERDEQSLMLFVASEGGKSACDRAKSLAKDWLNKQGNQMIIISSNTGLLGFNEPNLSLYMIPDPKSNKVVSKTQWNISCENVLYRAIQTHAPSSFIFDGPYPYRGVLNAIKYASGMNSIWLTSERTGQHIIERYEEYFSKTVEKKYSGGEIIPRQNRSRNHSSLSRKFLIATSYGFHDNEQKIPPQIRRSMSNYKNLKFVGHLNNISNNEDEEYFDELLPDIHDSRTLKGLQGAIVSDNIELITTLHSEMVPTLCILHEKTNPKIRQEIQELALSGGLFVTTWKDSDEIELFIDALVNRDWNLAITQNGTPETSNFLEKLLVT